LHQRLRFGADFEPELQRLALEWRRHWQDDIGQLRGRVHEQIGMHVEVERLQRLPAAQGIGTSQQHIRTEPHQPAHGVGVLVENRAIELF
jgi:hypothetical protein